MCRITYEPNYLKSINDSNLKPAANLQASLNELSHYKKRTKRGCRAGRYKQRQIHVVGSLREFQPPQYAAERGVNFHNLTQIQYTPCQGPSPANNFDDNDTPITPHDHDKQSVESSSVSQLPTFFMTNAQSLGNKFEDIEVVFEQNSVDVGVVTVSWFSNNMPENQLDINNYNLFSKHRKEKGGGGVAIYVKEDIPASHIDSIIVPSELECLWVKIRPKNSHVVSPPLLYALCTSPPIHRFNPFLWNTFSVVLIISVQNILILVF